MSVPTIIDTDSHLQEPPDLWTSRLPKSWGKDRVLHVEWNEDAQAEMWCIGGTPLVRAWLNMTYNWESTDLPDLGPPRFSDADPTNYDLKARIGEMDRVGIRAQCLYPNLGGFWFDPFVNNPDDELSIAHLQVYNDYVLEWSEPEADRFIGLATIPYWNIGEAVREIERISATHKGVIMTGAPHLHDQPYLGDRHWDPMWSAISDAGLSVSFHVANVGVVETFNPERVAVDGGRAATARAVPALSLINGGITTDLLMCGVLARFPELKFVVVESGIGWVPFVLEASDYTFKAEEVWRDRPEFGDLLPSDLFHRQVYVNYWYEHLEQWHIDAIGADNILFETDFPHNVHIWGKQVSDAVSRLDAFAPEIRDNVIWGNAAKLYDLPTVKPTF